MHKGTGRPDMLTYGVAAIAALITSQASAGKEPGEPPAPRLRTDIHLRDGSHLIATMSIDARLSVHTSFGDVEISLALLGSVEFRDDKGSVHLVFHNTDTLSGTSAAERFMIETSLGEIALPLQVVDHMKIRKPPMTFAPPTSLFDGDSLSGWFATPPWNVEGEAIVCPTTESINKLLCKTEIAGPFELTFEMELLRLRKQDAKGIFLENTKGQRIAVVRLDDQPNIFHIRSSTKVTATVPLRLETWYKIRFVLDDAGTLSAWLNDSHRLDTKVNSEPPFIIGLECERSGARFRNVVIRNARPYQVDVPSERQDDGTNG